MKRILFAFTALCASAFGQTPTVTSQFFRFQADASYDQNGAILHVPASGFFTDSVTINGSVFAQPNQQVSWDAYNTTKTVTIAVASTGTNVTLTDAEVVSAVMAAAQREKTAQSLQVKRPVSLNHRLPITSAPKPYFASWPTGAVKVLGQSVAVDGVNIITRYSDGSCTETCVYALPRNDCSALLFSR